MARRGGFQVREMRAACTSSEALHHLPCAQRTRLREPPQGAVTSRHRVQPAQARRADRVGGAGGSNPDAHPGAIPPSRTTLRTISVRTEPEPRAHGDARARWRGVVGAMARCGRRDGAQRDARDGRRDVQRAGEWMGGPGCDRRLRPFSPCRPARRTRTGGAGGTNRVVHRPPTARPMGVGAVWAMGSRLGGRVASRLSQQGSVCTC